jgi:hypothetical protein
MAVKFTDVMLRVADLPAAVHALQQALKFSAVENGDGWIALTDASGVQRIVLTDRDFGSGWALGCAQAGSEDPAAQFADWNTTALSALSEKGFALITHEAGLFVVVY